MALTDAYATAAEYRARVNQNGQTKDNEIESQLLSSSRLIELWCNRYFNQDDTVTTRYYDGTSLNVVPRASRQAFTEFSFNELTINGASRFSLKDDISTTTDLVVKVDLDGDYIPETTLTLDTHFWLGPWNVRTGPEPEPYRWLQIIPNNGVIATWPEHMHSIRIDAKFGWDAVPIAVKEATVILTRELIDIQKTGPAMVITEMHLLTRFPPSTVKLIQQVISTYGRARRTFV